MIFVIARQALTLVSGVSASFRVSFSVDRTYRLDSPPIMQGLSVPFACVGSGDPVRVLRLYTTNTLDVLLKHLLLRHMYNLPLPLLLCYAQALRSETSYCYCDLSVSLKSVALYCAVLYILLV